MNRSAFFLVVLLALWRIVTARTNRRCKVPDPLENIPAMKESAAKGDVSAEKELVKNLGSDDPAERFYAIRALKQITGETFGYVFYDDEIKRLPALNRWNDWLKQRQAADTPTSAP